MDEEKQEEQQQSFATAEVAAVTADGLRLILPGEEVAGQKVYKCNAAAQFQAGDRVMLCRDSGTYIVMFPIGSPGSRAPKITTLYDPNGNAAIRTGVNASGATFLMLGSANAAVSFYGEWAGYGKQYVADNANVATLIQALKNLRLFS